MLFGLDKLQSDSMDCIVSPIQSVGHYPLNKWLFPMVFGFCMLHQRF